MHEILFGHFLTRFEVLVLLFVAASAGGALYWVWQKRWHSSLATMSEELAKCQKEAAVWQNQAVTLEKELDRRDPERIKGLNKQLQVAISHESEKGLLVILEKSSETLQGLEKGQHTLREKQNEIVAVASVLSQHARNILDLFDPGWEEDTPKKELYNIRAFVEEVLARLDPYARSKRVTLLTSLEDVEPTFIQPDWTRIALANVVHNAIRHAYKEIGGGVVEIGLSFQVSILAEAEKAICIEVKDTGKGIAEKDQHDLFPPEIDLDRPITRGLGLLLARKAMRLQGGDVILVRSSLNKETVFRITIPYRDYRSRMSE